MSQVVVVGSYNQDHVWRVERFPRAGETCRGGEFSTGPGGKGFNQAVACARQGAATMFVGALGEDAIGAQARRLALAEGIDGCWAPCPSLATGSACILVDATAQNSIVVSLGANEQLDADFVRRKLERAEPDVLLCQLETNIEAVIAALAACGSSTLRLLNPAPVHDQLDAALLRQVDVLTPNETEFSQLLGKLYNVTVNVDSLAQSSDAELHVLCRRLDVPSVVITLGANGCFVSHADPARRHDRDACYRVAAEIVRPIDTTGAGDAFNGALAAALACNPGRPFRDLVISAGRVAALSTESRGAASAMPNQAQVLARFGR